MEAIGSGLVMLVDGTQMRDTSITDVEMGAPVSIENLIVHVMALGDHYDLKNKKLTIHHPSIAAD
jgi:cyanophycinase